MYFNSAALTFELLLALFAIAHTHLNVYLNLHEVTRLIGVSAELYYIRDGQLNDYALNFSVPVPPHINEISFTWQTLVQHKLFYSIKIETSEPLVLPQPTLNISNMGEIPLEPQTFSISIKCSGARSAEVEITIFIEIILNRQMKNTTDLILRRKKMCLREQQQNDNKMDVNNIIDLHSTETKYTRVRDQNNLDEEVASEGAAIGILAEVDRILKETISLSTDSFIAIIIVSILALVLIATILVIAYCAKGASKRQNHGVHLIKTSSFQRLPTISSTTITPTYVSMTHSFKEVSNECEEFQRRLNELTIQKCRLRLSSLIHEGTFSRIYKGTYNDCQEVLVKTVTQSASKREVMLLLQGGMMLYNFTHPHLLSVLGVSIEDYSTPLILYSANNNTRNLKLFLKNPTFSHLVTTLQIVLMSSQLVMAMKFLHEHGTTHKDVAARNCVINQQLNVKLTDSSLSHDLFPGDYNCLSNGTNRPIRWMPLETIENNNKYNEASDIWSFGVLMWEMCSLAELPYAEFDQFEMENYLKNGYRLPKPYVCPDELFTIMASCWSALATERPSFGQLQLYLSHFHTQITRFI